jgi:dipeptidyl aminopeptidase/acylaminoacyl peptidase
MSEMKKEKKRVIAVEDLFNLKEIGEPTFRPGTNEVYYTVTQAHEKENNYKSAIWQFQKRPQQFTQGLTRDFSIKCSPDGQTLAFISIRGNPTSKDKSVKPQIFVMPFTGGEAVQLTSVENGVTTFNWNKDSKEIVFISRLNKEELERPSPSKLVKIDVDELAILETKRKRIEEAKIDPRVIRRTDFLLDTSFRDDRFGQIFVINLKTKKVKRWTSNSDFDLQQALFVPDGSCVISVRQKPGEDDETRNYELLRITPDGKNKIIAEFPSWSFTSWGWTSAPLELSPDGKYIVTNFLDTEKGGLGNTKIGLINMENGSLKILAEEIDAEKFISKWSEDGNYLYFQVEEKSVCGIWRLNTEDNRIEQIVGGIKYILGYDLSEDGEWLTYQAYQVSDPSILYRYHLPSKIEEILHAPNEDFLDKIQLGKTEEIWYDGYQNDYKINGWIVKPPGFDHEKKHPLALNIHGGPHVMWTPHQSIPLFHEFQLLAAEGYVLFYCNPRGSGGYGSEFRTAIEKDWGEKASKDILQGIEYVVAMGFVDEKHMGITGGSYGGYMTSWIVCHDHRFASAVAQRGVYTLDQLWRNTVARKLLDDEFGGEPIKERDVYWKNSPLAYAQNVKTPLLIIHAENDFRAPIADAEALFVTIRIANPELDLELVRYPRDGHELSRSGEPLHRIDRLKRIVGWFDKYCQPKKEKDREKKELAVSKAKESMRKLQGKMFETKKKR